MAIIQDNNPYDKRVQKAQPRPGQPQAQPRPGQPQAQPPRPGQPQAQPPRPGQPQAQPPRPGQPPKPNQVNINPDQAKRDQDKINREQDILNRKLQKMSRSVLSKFIVAAPLSTPSTTPAATPQKIDPMDLWRQIMPIMQKWALNTSALQNKTSLVPNSTNKEGDNLYNIPLRRNAEISFNTVKRIVAEDGMKCFDSLTWTTNGMVLQIWYPYNANKNQPAAPATPAVMK